MLPLGSHLWEGYHGDAQLATGSFRELDDIHGIGHVDAAFRMHNTENSNDHDHIYFFLVAYISLHYKMLFCFSQHTVLV